MKICKNKNKNKGIKSGVNTKIISHKKPQIQISALRGKVIYPTFVVAKIVGFPSTGAS